MNKEELGNCLIALNTKFAEKGIYGEIGMYGGAVMCLALNARESTYDIDAIFNPKYDIAQAAKEVAVDLGLEPDWLNDGVKGFISDKNEMIPFKQLSNLNLFVASAEYMFAMKAVSCRMENKSEISDIKFLLNYLQLANVEQAEKIIYKYYPANRVLPKTVYFLIELLGGD